MINYSKDEGVIYPLPKKIIDNMLNNSKNIFIKFTSHEPTKKTILRIRPGYKLYLYQSESEKTIVGEAVIKRIEYTSIKDILKKYIERIILSRKELIAYGNGRENKKLLTLHLSNLRRYNDPFKLKKSITMSGQFVTQENKCSLFNC